MWTDEVVEVWIDSTCWTLNVNCEDIIHGWYGALVVLRKSSALKSTGESFPRKGCIELNWNETLARLSQSKCEPGEIDKAGITSPLNETLI